MLMKATPNGLQALVLPDQYVSKAWKNHFLYTFYLLLQKQKIFFIFALF